jgi:hypothetical protein
MPRIVRRCHECSCERFVADGKFRVNASHKVLDVWLLVLCSECGTTIKLEVLERATVRSIGPELLNRLHVNDVDLAAELLQNPSVRRRNRVSLDWDDAWRLDTGGPVAVRDDAIDVAVRNAAQIPVRPVQLIAEGFGLTRGEVGRLKREPACSAERPGFGSCSCRTQGVLPNAPQA